MLLGKDSFSFSIFCMHTYWTKNPCLKVLVIVVAENEGVAASSDRFTDHWSKRTIFSSTRTNKKRMRLQKRMRKRERERVRERERYGYIQKTLYSMHPDWDTVWLHVYAFQKRYLLVCVCVWERESVGAGVQVYKPGCVAGVVFSPCTSHTLETRPPVHEDRQKRVHQRRGGGG